jgi:flagellar biosynthesis protein FliQ
MDNKGRKRATFGWLFCACCELLIAKARKKTNQTLKYIPKIVFVVRIHYIKLALLQANLCV